MTYGGTVPTITPMYAGFVNGDTVGVARHRSRPVRPPPPARLRSPGRPYARRARGRWTPNYAFSYAAGTVTVTTVPLDHHGLQRPMTYGGTAPAITPAYLGFVNGDTSSSLTTKPACSTTATSSSPVSGSPYSSSCSGAVDPNYAISYTAGTVTVGPAPLTVTASNGSMTYGSAPPAVTPVYSGFVNGDTASSLTTQPTCTTAATSSSTVAGSPVPVLCSGAGDPNYAIGYAGGAMTVKPAPLTITAQSTSMTYGGPVPDDLAPLLGLRQRRRRGLAHHGTNVHHQRDDLQSRLGQPLLLLVQRGGGPELRHDVRQGHRHHRPRPDPHHRRLERLHDLRRHPAGDHAGLLGLHHRRHRIVAHDQADVHDHGDELRARSRRAPTCPRAAGRSTPTTRSCT